MEKVREWTPFDDEVLLDDIGAVLDEVIPPGEDLDVLAQRLRGHLRRLMNIALAAEADHRDKQAARLIERARMVRSESLPADQWQAVGHLRRMGWIVNELLEPLVETKCLKAAA